MIGKIYNGCSGSKWVQPTLYTFYRSIERFEIYGDVLTLHTYIILCNAKCKQSNPPCGNFGRDLWALNGRPQIWSLTALEKW